MIRNKPIAYWKHYITSLFSFQLCFFNSYKKKIPILDKKKKNQNLNWKKLI